MTSSPLLHPGLANQKAHPSRRSDFYAVEWGMVPLRPIGIFFGLCEIDADRKTSLTLSS